MSEKQDRNGVRTAQDIERKYDFSSLFKAVKNIKLNTETITKVEKQLETFSQEVLELQTDVREKITTWYYLGVPTLANLPASEWLTDEDKDKHLKDIYYDKNTGYTYIFVLESNVYKWNLIKDSDLAEALSIANAAQDTADGKRRIFTGDPIPPYDNGDLWIRDGEIYLCQISKEETESYEEDDFIIATNYTDDTYAKKVEGNLEVLKGTVTSIKESADSFKIEIATELTTIKDGIQTNKEEINKMSYTFGTDNLSIAKKTDPINAKINNTGMKVYNYETLKTIINHNGTGVQKLIVVGDSQIANIKIVKSVDENNKECTDIHHLVSNYQTLEDLE